MKALDCFYSAFSFFWLLDSEFWILPLTMKHTITLIPGDGIGPEVSAAVVRIIEAAGADIQWETHYAGAQALEKFGDTLPEELLESIKRNKLALKGPITTP